MPVWFHEYRNDGPRIRAWTAHYAAKGCHAVKAERVARDRCWRKGGWPPKKS